MRSKEDTEASKRIELAATATKPAEAPKMGGGGLIVLEMANETFSPEVKEDKKTEWVKFGRDNLFPDRVNEMAEASPVHSSILKLKADRTAGDGFVFDGDTATIGHLFESKLDDDLDTTLYKCAVDFTTFGGFYLQVIWDDLPNPGKPLEVQHLDFLAVRSGKADDRGRVGSYYVSRDWKNYRKEPNTPKRYAAFDRETAKENRTQILFIKSHAPGRYYYPRPDYAAALPDIQADAELQTFRLCNIQNGFLPSTMVSIPGDPGEDGRAEVKKNLKAEFSGTKNAGKFILVFSPDPEHPVQITPLDNKQNGAVYSALSADINQNIFSAHRLSSPVLAGIPGKGSLGGNGSEIREANEAFHNTVIKRYQKDIIAGFRKIFRECGYLGGAEIGASDPIAFKLGESVLLQVLTTDEVRALIGYEPKPDETPTLSPAQMRAIVTSLAKQLERRAVAMAKATLDNGKEVFIDEDTYEVFYVIDGDDRAEVVEDGDYVTDNEVPISVRDGKLFTGSAGAITPRAIDFLNRYKYVGPNDSKNRDFCKGLLLKGGTYSVYEIQAMSAERGYDCFADAGGANCRHKWVKA